MSSWEDCDAGKAKNGTERNAAPWGRRGARPKQVCTGAKHEQSPALCEHMVSRIVMLELYGRRNTVGHDWDSAEGDHSGHCGWKRDFADIESISTRDASVAE